MLRQSETPKPSSSVEGQGLNEEALTTNDKRWTLDGEPFDIESSDLADEDRALAEQMEVGDEMVVGGGAFAEFVLERVA